MAPTDTGYRDRDYIRICDICLHRFHMSELRPIGELRWACKDDAPGLTANRVSRYNARARPLRVKPNKWARPVSQIPTYAAAEAATFNFIAQAAPADTIGGASNVISAAWAAIYMADIVNQALRPSAWIATATATLKTCLTYLRSQQYGDPMGISPAGSVQDPRYGGIFGSAQYVTSTAIAAGIAFLKGYRALGDYNLLLAAERVATFLRHMQCGDLFSAGCTVYPVSGSAYHVGGLASTVVDSSGAMSNGYSIDNVLGLWFLALLVAARSPSATYGDGAATSFYSAPTLATLATMQSELLAFAQVGAKDSGAGGALVTGISPTAPKALYSAALNTGAGTASWTASSTISGEPLAMALLGLYQGQGMTSQVSAMLAWLAAFTPNPANATPVQPESVTILGSTGTYNPALCVASSLQASAPFMEAAGAVYQWSAGGILSPVLAGLSPGLRTSKDTLAQPQRRSTRDVVLVYLGPQGKSGLSLQPIGSPSVQLAAKAGMIYRQPPGMYPRVALF